MKLVEIRDAYYYNTGKVSDLCRSLSFSGIAVVWILRTGQGGDIAFAKSLSLVLVLLVASLFADFVHYFSQACTWGIYNRRNYRKGHQLDDEIHTPEWLNHVPLAMWILKSALCVLGMFILLSYLVKRI